MRTKVKEIPMVPAVHQGCAHYWVIESANGPTSRGVCKFCGEKREFRNSWYDLLPSKKHQVDVVTGAIEKPAEGKDAREPKEQELSLDEAIGELLKN